jgi:Uma2 family endonuclease
MSLPENKKGKKYTYKDYLGWTDNGRYELIDGIIYDLAPAPSTAHQRVLRRLFFLFESYLNQNSDQAKDCELFTAPFDVRIPLADEKDEEIETVVQPDIVIICDQSGLDEKGYRGTPDLIVEILSPATAQKDMVNKLNLYERAGVKKYWIIHPIDRTVMVLKIGINNRYGRPETYTAEDKIKTDFFTDLTVALDKVFPG